jgi:RimJ/RimL family protein N-acetyltransferase
MTKLVLSQTKTKTINQMQKLLTFETDRLFIRPVTKDDAAFIHKLVNTPKWLENIGDRKVYSAVDAEQYITSRITSQFDRLGFGNYMVTRKVDGELLGNCGLYDRPGLEGVDLGFAFLAEHEGQGYGFEAAHRLKEAAKVNFGLTRLQAITIKSNIASQRLLSKLGFTFEKMTTVEAGGDTIMLFVCEL